MLELWHTLVVVLAGCLFGALLWFTVSNRIHTRERARSKMAQTAGVLVVNQNRLDSACISKLIQEIEVELGKREDKAHAH